MPLHSLNKFSLNVDDLLQQFQRDVIDKPEFIVPKVSPLRNLAKKLLKKNKKALKTEHQSEVIRVLEEANKTQDEDDFKLKLQELKNIESLSDTASAIVEMIEQEFSNPTVLPSQLELFKQKIIQDIFPDLHQQMAMQYAEIQSVEPTPENLAQIKVSPKTRDRQVCNLLNSHEMMGLCAQSHSNFRSTLVEIFMASSKAELATLPTEHLASKNPISDEDYIPLLDEEYAPIVSWVHGGQELLTIPRENKANVGALFHKLVTNCSTITRLIEKNNDIIDNNMEILYAYKLMKLYVGLEAPIEDVEDTFNNISQRFRQLLGNSGFKVDQKPFHDALILLEFPNDMESIDIEAWRTLLDENGTKAFSFFARANEIEAYIGRAPTSIEEAEVALMHCEYPNASEDEDFARLCRKHKVSNEMFEAGLAFIGKPPVWPKKDTDNLPDIEVVGVDEAAGFRIRKLAPDEKEGLILGQITDCCQSINGHSSQCVTDGYTLEDNGFYVIEDIKRNKIIGQAYAWRTQNGNLCLDSVECLRDNINPVQLKALLSEFSSGVMEADPEIRLLTVGMGGKTPINLFNRSLIAETMRMGHLYGDAQAQYLIANKAVNRYGELPDEVVPPGEFRAQLDYLRAYLPEDEAGVDAVVAHLAANPTLETALANQGNLQLLLHLSQFEPSLDDILPIDFAELDALPADEKSVRLAEISPVRLAWNILVLKAKPQTDLLTYLPESFLAHALLSLAKVNASRFDGLYERCNKESEVGLHVLAGLMTNLDVLYQTSAIEAYQKMAPERQVEVINSANRLRSPFVRTADDIQALRISSSDAAFARLFETVVEHLPNIVDNSKNKMTAFCLLLNSCSDAQRHIVFDKMKNKLPELLTTTGDIVRLGVMIPLDKRLEFFQVTQARIKTLFEESYSGLYDAEELFSKILRVPTDEKFQVLCEAWRVSGVHSFESGFEFSQCSNNLRGERQNIFFDVFKDKLSTLIQTESDLLMLLDDPLEEGAAQILFDAIKENISDFITITSTLASLIGSLPASMHQEVFEVMDSETLEALIQSVKADKHKTRYDHQLIGAHDKWQKAKEAQVETQKDLKERLQQETGRAGEGEGEDDQVRPK